VASWTRDRIARIQSKKDPALLAFIDSLTATLRGGSAPAAKLNLLAFLESLAAHDGAAQMLINSSLTPTLVALFEQDSGTALRVRVATLLGVLIRYATTIDIELIIPGACKSELRAPPPDARRRLTHAALCSHREAARGAVRGEREGAAARDGDARRAALLPDVCGLPSAVRVSKRRRVRGRNRRCRRAAAQP
jgi:hypothetical protein